jgi:hypothetical protein
MSGYLENIVLGQRILLHVWVLGSILLYQGVRRIPSAVRVSERHPSLLWYQKDTLPCLGKNKYCSMSEYQDQCQDTVTNLSYQNGSLPCQGRRILFHVRVPGGNSSRKCIRRILLHVKSVMSVVFHVTVSGGLLPC